MIKDIKQYLNSSVKQTAEDYKLTKSDYSKGKNYAYFEALKVVEKLAMQRFSQQRELLLAYEEYTSYKVLGKKTPRISKQMVEDFLANNCG